MNAHDKDSYRGAVISDFDGTLADTSKDRGLWKLRKAAAHVGLICDSAAEDRAIQHWGRTLPDLFKGAFEDADPDQIEELVHQFAHLDFVDPPLLFDGVKEALRELADKRVALTILSSRDTPTLEHILKHHGIHSHFCHIVSEGTVPGCKKPDLRIFACTVAKLSTFGIHHDQWTYIGDTLTDLLAGRNLGVRTIIVDTGFGIEHVKSDEPFETLPSISHLPRLLLND